MPNAIPRVTRRPTAVYAELLDFSGWDLLTSLNTLASATASVSPSGPTLGTPTVDATNKEVSVPWSGGTSGVKYRLSVLATTSGGDVIPGDLDVAVTTASTDGIVVYPSQFLPYIDGARAVELCFDEGTIAVGTAYPDPSQIDGLDNARAIADGAWYEVLTACSRGEIYQGRELIDLANDPSRGQVLIKLLANLFWADLIGRRRYAQGEPQAEDVGYKRAQETLEQLRLGERVFDLTGVVQTDASGVPTGSVYGNPVGEASHMSSGRLGVSRTRPHCRQPDDRFWVRGRRCC
jgi:hypothetical protein